MASLSSFSSAAVKFVAIQLVNSRDFYSTFGDASVKKFYAEGSEVYSNLRRVTKAQNLQRFKAALHH